MNLSAPFIARPIATGLLTAGIVLLGLVAYALLPISALPDIDFPTIQVVAQSPGASAETMATSVAAPLERALGQINGVTEMTSSSSFGRANITVQFELNRNIDGAAQDVQTAINAAAGQLPKTLPNPPTYEKVNPSNSSIISLALTSDVLPIRTVDDYADNFVIQQLSHIDGVGLVDMNGEQKPAMRIQVNPQTIASLGIGFEDLRAAITAATANGPKGVLDGRDRASTIAANDQLFDAASFRELIVAYHAGSAVKLGDIATVLDDVENTKLKGWFETQRGIIVDVHKQPGQNVAEIVGRVKAALPSILKALPPTIRVAIIGDRTQTIRASARDVQITLLVTILLVVIVMYLFLRNLWATAITSIVIPVSLIGTFAAMYALGYSLNNLSLIGLTIAVGFVVDDAIVMIENVTRHVERGEGPMAAAIKGARQVGFTILTMTVSLIAVFIPVLLMGGVVGRLFREFAVTVGVAILISGLVSVTLTPMLCARVLRRHEPGRQQRSTQLAEDAFAAMHRFYERTLNIVMKHQALTFGLMLATLAASILLYVFAPKGFFPQQDTGQIIGTTEGAPYLSSAAMAEYQQEFARIVLTDPDVASLFSFVGANSLSGGRIVINLKPFAERHSTSDDVIRRLRPKLAKVRDAQLFLQARQDIQVGARQSKTQFQYTLQDPDIGELYRWAPIVFDKLKTLPQLRDLAIDLQSRAPQTSLAIDRLSAARLGVSAQAIDDTLYDAFGQRQVATVFTQLNQYKVVLEAEPRWQEDESGLDRLYVRSATTGAQVPLSSFVKVSTSLAPLSINHQNQFPAVTLSFNLAKGASLGDAVAAVETAERALRTPDTLIGEFQGSARAFRQSLATQPYLIIAAIIAVYLVLGILYESMIHPLTILSTLPSAGLGALVALLLSGYDLSVMAIVGVLLLIGIVKKNGIMMLDFALAAEREEGMEPRQAIFQAALTRFRPIMMTTMAAILGALPLAFGTGAGSELRRPLGIAVVGGLVVSQALTLYTTPVVYLYLDRFGRWIGRRHRRMTVAPTANLVRAERDAAE